MKPNLCSLILTGGMSSRMGEDKSLLEYHNKPQWLYLADTCKQLGINTFVSCRFDQEISKQTNYPVIIDQYASIGPMGGILSAFKHDPLVAWLIIACDMPGIDVTAIRALSEQRDCSKMATVSFNQKAILEPLFSILEPTILDEFLLQFKEGFYSIKKVMEKKTSYLLPIIFPDSVLQNINTPEDLKIYKNVK